MLKRILAAMLAIVLMVTFAACGDTSKQAPAEVIGETNEAVPEKEESAGEEKTAEEEVAAPEITFTEQILVDDENCTVKITGIEEDAIWGYTLKVFLENKTDLELMYSVDMVSVNGYMCDPFWGTSVTAQMKANEEISFATESFERNGIETPSEISFTLRVSDYNDWAADALVEQEFTVYPLGEEAVQVQERVAQPEDVVLLDNEQCKMVVTGFETDDIWGYTMKVYLENKTEKELMFSVDGVAVNGFMCDPFWAEAVAAGKCSNTGITWYTETLEESGITEEITEIVLPVRVYDNNDWMAEDIVNQTVTVNP